MLQFVTIQLLTQRQWPSLWNGRAPNVPNLVLSHCTASFGSTVATLLILTFS